MIFGKVGRLGHGKTMRAAVEALALAERRRAVLASNIVVRVPSAVPFVLLPMDSFSETLGALLDRLYECDVCQEVEEVLVVEERPSLVVELGAAGFDVDAPRRAQVRHGGPGCERVGVVVLVDEVDTIWDARAWQDMSKLDRFRIKQSRKLGCDLIWTAQFSDQVEKGVRNITESVELLRAYPGPSLDRRERGKRPWLLRGESFRPGAMRDLMGTADRDKRLGSAWYRYRREHEDLYDTDELVRPPDEVPRRGRSSPSSSVFSV